jgi:tetratricopeptide (TPR) repeat protein
MRILVTVFTLLGLLATPSLADKKLADAHKQRARALENQSAFDDAIAEYKAAYDTGGGAGSLYNIARIYDEKKDDPRTAIEFYEKFFDADRANDADNEGIRELLADARRRVAADDERRRRAEDARVATENERKRAAVEQHVMSAASYARAGGWAAAAEQHLKAFDLDGDPMHILAAAVAYRNQRDLPRSLETYQRYLDKAPSGPGSEEARKTIAKLTREIANAEQAKRDRAVGAVVTSRDGPRSNKPGRISPTWLVIGGALLITGVIVDRVPASARNGKLDATDFAPAALYGLGATAIIRGLL